MTFSVPVQPRSSGEPQIDSRVPRSEGIVIPMSRGSEISLTLKPLPGEGFMELFARLATRLKDSNATIAHLMILGATRGSSAGTEALRRVFGNLNWPVTWIECAACDGQPLAGIQVTAVRGCDVRPIVMDGCVVGSVFEDREARHCVLGGVGPDENSFPRMLQAGQALENLERALAQAQFVAGDLVRTWFYLQDIVSWYHDFNTLRTRRYSEIPFRTGALPASTGVEGRNPSSSALVIAARALQPLNGSGAGAEVRSPLQCPAPQYGSGFSRAMQIDSSSGRRLFVSGTASIATDGYTMWKGDSAKQIERTLEVVEAILRSRGFAPGDVTRAIAYFKNRGDIERFNRQCAANGWDSMPVIAVESDICRDDLLFELEVDAWKASEPGRFTADFVI